MGGPAVKSFICVAFAVCFLTTVAHAQQTSVPVIMEPDRFDQWGDIRPNDENTHLDKIAAQAKEWPLSIIHLVIHAGQTACNGEAKARGVRARNYLISHGISPERIEVTDAGWRKEVSVQVWIWPPQLGKPKISSESNLKPNAVKLEKKCKMKSRGRVGP
jgi:hypothetical protein